jgi:hypothetical protein
LPQLAQLEVEPEVDIVRASFATATSAISKGEEALREPVGWLGTDGKRLFEYLKDLQLKPKFDQAEQALKDMAKLMPNWNSYGAAPPSRETRDRAAETLVSLQRLSFLPTKVVPSSEGGVTIFFIREDRYADIEFLNTGEMLAVTYVGVAEPQVWAIENAELEAAIGRIRQHLAA